MPPPLAGVQEIPIKPLVVRVPETTKIIERTFVERQTEPLPTVPPIINIEVPAAPPPVAAPHIVVNVERSKDENNQSVPGETTPVGDTPRIEKERGSASTPEVPPVTESVPVDRPPTEQVEPKSLTPEPEKRSGEKPKEVNTPPPARKPETKKRANGKPGRKNTELQHAINWIVWEQTGFDKSKCPWKNPYECKKHQPPDENLVEARRFLGFDF